jgi:hypothetical protein
MIKALKGLLERIKQRLSTKKIVPPEAVDLPIFFEAPIPIFLCDEKGKVLEQNRKLTMFLATARISSSQLYYLA